MGWICLFCLRIHALLLPLENTDYIQHAPTDIFPPLPHTSFFTPHPALCVGGSQRTSFVLPFLILLAQKCFPGLFPPFFVLNKEK